MTTEDSGEAVCPVCHGSGDEEVAFSDSSDRGPQFAPCRACGGTGEPAPENSEGSVPAEPETFAQLAAQVFNSRTVPASTDRIQEARTELLTYVEMFGDRVLPNRLADVIPRIDTLIARVRESVEGELGKRRWRVVPAPELDQATSDGVLYPGQRIELIECENCEEQREKYQGLVKAAAKAVHQSSDGSWCDSCCTPDGDHEHDCWVPTLAALSSTEIKGETTG